MRSHMLICTYLHPHEHAHTHAHTQPYIKTRTHTHARTHAHIHACTHAHTYMVYALLAFICSDKVAYESLKAAHWMVEAAIDYYFASGLSATTPSVDPKAVDQLFGNYKGELIFSVCNAPSISSPACVTSMCASQHLRAVRMLLSANKGIIPSTKWVCC